MKSPSGIKIKSTGSDFGHIPDPPEPYELSLEESEQDEMLYFYLTDHDFQIFVNKGMQTYKRTRSEVLQDSIVREYYLSMQRGGCNEKRNSDRGL